MSALIQWLTVFSLSVLLKISLWSCWSFCGCETWPGDEWKSSCFLCVKTVIFAYLYIFFPVYGFGFFERDPLTIWATVLVSQPVIGSLKLIWSAINDNVRCSAVHRPSFAITGAVFRMSMKWDTFESFDSNVDGFCMGEFTIGPSVNRELGPASLIAESIAFWHSRIFQNFHQCRIHVEDAIVFLIHRNSRAA